MRASFRTVQVGVLMAVLAMTFAAVGLTTFVYARLAVSDLSGQVLTQTSERIDLRVREVVESAVLEADIARRLIETGQIGTTDHDRMLRYFVQVMRAQDHLTYMSWGTEEGWYWHVKRTQTGLRLQTVLEGPNGRPDLNEYVQVAGGATRLVFRNPITTYDPRKRPYYRAAVAAGGPTWTESYVFMDHDENRSVTGVTRAVPVYLDGTLQGVLTVDIDLVALSDFLAGVAVGRSGFAFLLEDRADGSRRLIAHPDRALLSGSATSDVVAAIPATEVADPVVRALAAKLPADIAGLGDAIVPVRLSVDGHDYFGAFERVGGEDAPPWLLAAVLPVDDVMGGVQAMTRTASITMGLGLLVAIVLGVLIARVLSRTLVEIEAELRHVAHFELSARLLADTRSGIAELDDMRAATDAMKQGLRSFGRYVPTELVRQLIVAGGEARLGADRRDMTVLLADLAGFTTFVESTAPEVVLDTLGEYLAEMNLAILGTDGTVCQYLGDAVLAFWGAPVAQPDHALRACRGALAMRARARALAESSAAGGRPVLSARFGLCSGDTLVGNIGAPDRFNYGCVGDPVTTATRLEALNKAYGTTVLISASTAALVGDALVTRPVDEVRIEGHLVWVHELIGEPAEVGPHVHTGIARYREGLDALRDGRLHDAERAFRAARQAFGGVDGPSSAMLERCAALASAPHGAQIPPARGA